MPIFTAFCVLLSGLRFTAASETPDYKISQLHDTLEIVSPKGMTLWLDEPLQAPVSIEYDACLMLEEGHPEDRLSDLNVFWMASMGQTGKSPVKLSGRFVDSYRMQLYYMGYGGNSNKTTRFRRYNGDARGVDSAQYRPAILKEYTDEQHLNKANQWRHICVTADADGRVTYTIDGEQLIDYLDPSPLRRGWFGIRTTWSRLRVANVRITPLPSKNEVPTSGPDSHLFTSKKGNISLPLHTIHQAQSNLARAVNFGIPFDMGQVKEKDEFLLDGHPLDFIPLAYWPDGSVKWGGYAGTLTGSAPAQSPELHHSQSGLYWADSLTYQGRTILKNATCQYKTDGKESPDTIVWQSINIERTASQQTVILAHSDLVDLRIYLTQGTPEVRLVHSYCNLRPDSAAMLRSLYISCDIPMSEELYNRHIAFSLDSIGQSEQLKQCWHEPVQPLTGRRTLPDNLYQRQMQGERVPPVTQLNDHSQTLISHWATWDAFRLSQLNDMGYTIRKRAKQENTPWIGTFAGSRNPGSVFVGETTHGLVASLHDFWQSYPSSIVITGMTSKMANLRIELWSEDAEPMDLRHYDIEAHDLNASYEDVQPGMSTPFGIARTSEISLFPTTGWIGDEAFSALANDLQHRSQLISSPEYLHQRHAFGVWSLPYKSETNTEKLQFEQGIRYWNDFYVAEVDRRHWYGYWNYGDVMHTYDTERKEWRYDIGGFAWDNTELASNMMLWYSFLRTGRADLWNLCVAMTRHTSEVDVYHAGPWAGLGSRHNVTHWGCGAKESRISEAAWNRFYYYLSGGDERLGELMHAVVDSDTLLYHLDPMRLAQPRSPETPCTAPARLRIGPDWLGYVSNWMTEWERTRNLHYLHKIITGMRCINSMPHGIFSGPKALGYDPATGVISWEGDPNTQHTNHLLSLMGGFEMLGELLPLPIEQTPGLSRLEKEAVCQFRLTWLDYCQHYRSRTKELNSSPYHIPRLSAYAAWQGYNPESAAEARKVLNGYAPQPGVPNTNNVSTWCLDVIYMMEVLP